VAYEIARDLGWRAPAFVAVPSGNLGNVAALHAGFARLLRLGLIATMPRLIACQVDAANPLFRWWRAGGAGALQPVTAAETHASAIRIGDPVSFPRAKKALLARAGSAGSGGSSLFADEAQGFGGQGLVTSCSEPELLHAMARADREGLFVCPHTAAALAGLAQLERARSSPLQSHLDVVVVSTASGLKFAEQKAAFHEGSTGLGALDLPASTSSLRNPPLRLPATLDDVQRALHARGIG
jgi:threonine synthase